MQRRSVLFWLSLGLFQLGEALQINGLDRLAAAAINVRRRRAPSRPAQPTPVVAVEPTPPPAVDQDAEDQGEPGDVDPQRKARHGRPPSRWLRSLEAEELSTWLTTIDLPEYGVSGMTVWIHLTRDHLFDAAKIEGLTENEQDRLHAAAHAGY